MGVHKDTVLTGKDFQGKESDAKLSCYMKLYNLEADCGGGLTHT